MEKFEGIEKLRERAKVSYGEAKEAYEKNNGDLLEALIYLENQGKVAPPINDGYYSSEGQDQQYYNKEQDETFKGTKSNFKESLDKLWQLCAQIIKKGNSTSFEILKNEEYLGSVPVTILVLLLIFAPVITIPAIIIGLFFGFHYQFVGTNK